MLEASLILVNYRTEAHVRDCLIDLQSRPEELPAEILIVDNSPDRHLPRLLEQFGLSVQYIPTERNLGFAGGVNLGLERSREAIVILLNPDARIEAGCLSGLVDVLETKAGAAVAGPALVPFSDEFPSQPSATRRDPGMLTALIEYTFVGRVFSPRWLDDHYFLDMKDGRPIVDSAMVQGACLALKKEYIERVGLFDAERFFLYWEETDFCRRIRAAGGRVLYCPRLRCRHLGGASLEMRDQHLYHFWRGFHRYHRKHNGRVKSLLLQLLLIIGIGGECALLELLHLWRRGRDPKLASDMMTAWARLREQFHWQGSGA